MAIGTAAAIGLGVAGVGSALGARSQSKAAGKAADTSAQVARENNALARDIYGQNKGILDPYVQRGNAAGGTMNALLGLGGQAAQPNVLSQYQGPNPDSSAMGSRGVWDQYLTANPDVYQGWQDTGQAFRTPQEYAEFHYNRFGRNEGRALPTATMGQVGQTTPGQTPQQAANEAFDIFKNSTGYQFRVNEGNRALNAGWAGGGTLQSGAAGKAFQQFGQNIASQEFGNYMNYLGNQQGVGLGAGSALAGVGQNYVNTISANNNSAGSAAANAALIKGANNPFASVLGSVGGGILGRLG
jgi:hypothetical protein